MWKVSRCSLSAGLPTSWIISQALLAGVDEIGLETVDRLERDDPAALPGMSRTVPGDSSRPSAIAAASPSAARLRRDQQWNRPRRTSSGSRFHHQVNDALHELNAGALLLRRAAQILVRPETGRHRAADETVLGEFAFTSTGSMCVRSSTEISTVSNPHALNCGNHRVLRFVNGQLNRKVLMPKRSEFRFEVESVLERRDQRAPSFHEIGDDCVRQAQAFADCDVRAVVQQHHAHAEHVAGAGGVEVLLKGRGWLDDEFAV